MPSVKKSATALTIEDFRGLTVAKRRILAGQIAKDRTAGMSGNELRAKYGSWLSGPTRIKLLREFGHVMVVGKSYDSYKDGDTRKGTRHAREHGAKASGPKPRKPAAKKSAPKTGAARRKRSA
jgi:hypothetical protein